MTRTQILDIHKACHEAGWSLRQAWNLIKDCNLKEYAEKKQTGDNVWLAISNGPKPVIHGVLTVCADTTQGNVITTLDARSQAVCHSLLEKGLEGHRQYCATCNSAEEEMFVQHGFKRLLSLQGSRMMYRDAVDDVKFKNHKT